LLWPRRSSLVQEVDGLELRLGRAFAGLLAARGERLAGLRKALAWLSPAQRLERLTQGFEQAGRRLDQAGERFLELRRERLRAVGLRLERALGDQRLRERERPLREIVRRLERAAEGLLAQRGRERELLQARLAALDPEKPLERGYSLVRMHKDGRFLRSWREVAPGDRLEIRVRDGVVLAEAEQAGPKPEKDTGGE
jgi:exodeoxyribonuclease VII large subunit